MNEFDFAFETKALDDSGAIEGVAAGYGNIDAGGDLMLPGSISKSLVGKSRIPMLMYHDHKRPAGVWNEWREVPEGLLVKGRFAMSTDAGKEAHALVRDGALSGLSVGMHKVVAKMVGRARHIVEAALHEISLVSVPMNERAAILSVKDIMEAGSMPSVREFEEFLRDAGGFSKSLAAAIAAKATPHLRGEPEAKANDEVREFLERMRA